MSLKLYPSCRKNSVLPVLKIWVSICFLKKDDKNKGETKKKNSFYPITYS